jgi:hypothetical protein
VESKRGKIPPVKHWEIIADLSVILMTATLAITSAQAEPPPATIDCTFYGVDVVKLRLPGYTNTKVAPENIAWLKPGVNPRPGEIARGFVVLGRGTGHLTARTDLRKVCIKLAKVASDHGANAINYQILNHGTQIRVQFLRIEDVYMRMAGRRQNPPQ